MEEIWKDIEGYEGHYQVSNLGRVKSVAKKVWNGYSYWERKERILATSQHITGYIHVGLSKSDHRKSYKVHRLVAQAFIPNPQNKPYIDHINTIRTDNRVENLRWVDREENANNPLTRKHLSNSHEGIRHPKARPVMQLTLNGEYIKTWECMKYAERELGLKHISCCCRGKRNQCGGFKWQYC